MHWWSIIFDRKKGDPEITNIRTHLISKLNSSIKKILLYKNKEYALIKKNINYDQYFRNHYLSLQRQSRFKQFRLDTYYFLW